jgi:hypothetical protein
MAKTNKNHHKPVVDSKKAGFPSTKPGQPSGKDRAVVIPPKKQTKK